MVLYGELGTAEFARFHRAIKQHVLSGKIDYVIRHFVKVRNKRFNIYYSRKMHNIKLP